MGIDLITFTLQLTATIDDDEGHRNSDAGIDDKPGGKGCGVQWRRTIPGCQTTDAVATPIFQPALQRRDVWYIVARRRRDGYGILNAIPSEQNNRGKIVCFASSVCAPGATKLRTRTCTGTPNS